MNFEFKNAWNFISTLPLLGILWRLDHVSVIFKFIWLKLNIKRTVIIRLLISKELYYSAVWDHLKCFPWSSITTADYSVQRYLLPDFLFFERWKYFFVATERMQFCSESWKYRFPVTLVTMMWHDDPVFRSCLANEVAWSKLNRLVRTWFLEVNGWADWCVCIVDYKYI
jgi:hypothetical protein